jgi:hypothetical protein
MARDPGRTLPLAGSGEARPPVDRRRRPRRPAGFHIRDILVRSLAADAMHGGTTMPGTVKIWWHEGATKDARYNTVPVLNEPELGFETVAVTGTPRASGPAPEDATIAVIETDVNVRYLVRQPGGNASADPLTSKPIALTGLTTDFIGVAPGCSISFVEA